MYKSLSVLLTIVLITMLALPALAAVNKLDISIEENSDFMEIVSFEAGELFPLDQANKDRSAAKFEMIVSEFDIASVSDETITVEEVEINHELLQQIQAKQSAAADRMAPGWDWAAYKIGPAFLSSSDIIPLRMTNSFDAVFLNMGTATAPSTTAKVYLSNPSLGISKTLIHTINVDPMEPYSMNNLVYGYRFGVNLTNPPGEHTISVEINTTGQLENDYYSNTTEANYMWAAVNATIDPAYYDIVPSEDPITVGIETPVEFIIANAGDSITGRVPVYVSFYEESSGATTHANFITAPIPAGYARGYNATAKFYNPGDVTFNMHIDPDVNTFDSNRNNNKGSVGAVVSGNARPPQPYGQNKKNWCWAATSKIVAENNGGVTLSSAPQVLTNTQNVHTSNGVRFYGINENGQYTADGAQRSIVMHVKNGSDADATGYDVDKVAALQYASHNNMSIGTFGGAGNALTSAQIASIQSDLNNGKYVIGNFHNGIGHSVAILEYRSSDNTYRILDPYDLIEGYYPSSVFSTNSFPSLGRYSRIEWIQYCR